MTYYYLITLLNILRFFVSFIAINGFVFLSDFVQFVSQEGLYSSEQSVCDVSVMYVVFYLFLLMSITELAKKLLHKIYKSVSINIELTC